MRKYKGKYVMEFPGIEDYLANAKKYEEKKSKKGMYGAKTIKFSEIDILDAYINDENATIGSASRKLGCTRAMLRSILIEFGYQSKGLVSARKSTIERKNTINRKDITEQQILDLYINKPGATLQSAASQLRCSHETFRQVVIFYGFSSKNKGKRVKFNAIS